MNKSLYIRRKESGRCVDCGKKAHDKIRCILCSKRGTIFIERRFKKGQCRFCSKPRRSKYQTCQDCFKRKSKQGMERRRKLRASKLCISCRKSSLIGEMCSVCSKRRNSNRIQNRAHVRHIVLSHYSPKGEKPKCYCCKEVMLDFLTIDHIIHGSGNKHRAKIGKQRIYAWLLRNNLPSGYRTACSNCNAGAARHQGVCPHKLKQTPSKHIKFKIRETSCYSWSNRGWYDHTGVWDTHVCGFGRTRQGL